MFQKKKKNTNEWNIESDANSNTIFIHFTKSHQVNDVSISKGFDRF